MGTRIVTARRLFPVVTAVMTVVIVALVVVVFWARSSTAHTIKYHMFTTGRPVTICNSGTTVCIDLGSHLLTLANQLPPDLDHSDLRSLAHKTVRITWAQMPGSPFERSAIDVRAVG